MNETEKMNDMELTETANAPKEAAEFLPTETEDLVPMEVNETTCKPFDESIEPVANPEAKDSETTEAAIDDTAADEAVDSTEASVSAADESETFFDRILDVLYVLWDGFLDLMITLHILEEALPEQTDPALAASPASASGNGILHADREPDAPRLPMLSAPEPLPLAG